MQYHSTKMKEINKIIKEYWISTYKGGGKNPNYEHGYRKEYPS